MRCFKAFFAGTLLLLLVPVTSVAADSAEPIDDARWSPIASGWAGTDSAEELLASAVGGGVASPPVGLWTADRLTGSGDWCLGDDTDSDRPGDLGADLLWFSSIGACQSVHSAMTFTVFTARPAELIEVVIDSDLDETTGCDGFDLFYLATEGVGDVDPPAVITQVMTPTCDEGSWTAHEAGYGERGPDRLLTRWEIPGQWSRESSWYVGVANADGSGYDSSWTHYLSLPYLVECGGQPSGSPNADGGYWLAGLDGSMWDFGSAPHYGHACNSGNAAGRLVDLETVPFDDNGVERTTWVALYAGGQVLLGSGAFGVAEAPQPWQVGAIEAVALIPRHGIEFPHLHDFWVVYDNGAVATVSWEDMPWYGDLRDLSLNQPIIDAVGTPDGQGYWLVGLDGGVFSFGTATFRGSMGGLPLNEPVVAMVADPDGEGYWLVASDGGVFAFDAPFQGSIPGVLVPGQQLNRPIVGMVPYGNGYLMLGSDGGVFNFSDKPFVGSLGADPHTAPIVSVAAP
ncbi:MAG: hypothetical protein GY749_13465 [Desulfobacteraceae bacterium]|nr:hypothetical protein [Desulfobacteraceae bacterium]